MNISITERFRPFSHIAGTEVLVPNSDWVICVFPTLIQGKNFEYPICKRGPVKEFTVQNDLDKGCVWIWGKSPDGHFRIKIFADEKGLHLVSNKEQTLLAKGGVFVESGFIERLFLGCHKAQDIDLVKRRLDSREIAPMIFLLGQKGVKNPAEIRFEKGDFEQEFNNFYLSHFKGLFSPQEKDLHHLGISKQAITGDLLKGAYLAIRSLLIDQEKILPSVPLNWVFGKITGLKTEFGLVDLEWSRGQIRRLILHAEKEAPFEFAKPIKTFRVRKVKSKIFYDNFKK